MHPDLAPALALLNDVTRGVSYEQLAKPADGKWSPAEVLDHLRLAYHVGASVAERCLAEGQPRARRQSIKERLAAFLVIDLHVFPKAKAPGAAVPQGVPSESIVADTLAAIETLDDVLTRAADRFGERTPLMNHPYFGGLDVRTWRRFHVAHTKHHVKQIRERLGTAG